MAKPSHATPPGPLLRKQQPTQPSIPVAGMKAKSHQQPNHPRSTCKNYATSKAGYTKTQLDLPDVRSLLVYLDMQLFGCGVWLPKALAEFLSQVLTCQFKCDSLKAKCVLSTQT